MANDKQARRATKQAAKEARRAAAAAAAEAGTRASTRNRNLLLGIPTVAVALGAAAHWGLGSDRLAVLALVAGALLWIVVGLGMLGGSVRPRSRVGASGLGFGKRERR